MSKLVSLYVRSAAEAATLLRRQWLLIPATMLLAFIGLQLLRLVSSTGPMSGFVAGILLILLASTYLGWLQRMDHRRALHWREFLTLDQGLVYATLNAAFILFVAQFIVQTLTADLNAAPARLGIGLLIYVVFNSLPESIYIGSYAGSGALGHAALFTRDHWIEWYAPQLVLLLPWLILGPERVLVAIASANPLLPIGVVVQGTLAVFSPTNILSLLGVLAFAVVMGSWFMLFRGALFRALEAGRWRRG